MTLNICNGDLAKVKVKKIEAKNKSNHCISAKLS